MTRIQKLKEINKAACKRGHVAVQLQMFVRWSIEDRKKKNLLKTKSIVKKEMTVKRPLRDSTEGLL